MRFGLGVLAVTVLLGCLLAAARPQTARCLDNCTATQLVPELREVTVNQGVGSYARLVRGKETLVKFFLSNPTACAVTNSQSLKVTAATLSMNNTVQTFTGIAPFQSFAAAPLVTAALSTNSAADPIFAVPGANLVPPLANPDTDTFTPTFTATVTYSRKNGTTTTNGLTATFSNSTTVTFERRTRALRVLVIPMGDGSPGVLDNTQYTAADQQGRNIGARLVAWANDRASQRGHEWLRLDCFRTNTKLHAYYEGLGFQRVATVEHPSRGSGALFQRPVTPLRHYRPVQELPAREHIGR